MTTKRKEQARSTDAPETPSAEYTAKKARLDAAEARRLEDLNWRTAIDLVPSSVAIADGKDLAST